VVSVVAAAVEAPVVARCVDDILVHVERIVRAGAAVEGVVAGLAVEVVVAGVAVKDIVAVAAAEDVALIASFKVIGPRPAVKLVPAARP
jgi:hypothetical protein